MLNFDLNILKALESGRNTFFNFIFQIFTFLGEGPVAFAIIFIFYFLIDKKFGRKFVYIFATSISLNGVIKNFVKRVRPFKLEGENHITCLKESTATGYSFPSGHSQNVATYSTTITYEYKKKWMLLVSIPLMLLVAFSRIYVGAHYPTDVICGLAFGIGFSILFSILFDKVGEKKMFLITIFGLLPFAILFMILQDDNFADLYKTYGLLVGGYLAILFEDKYVNFSVDNKKWIRFIFGAGGAGVTYLLLSLLLKPLPVHGLLLMLLSFIRYGLVAFIGMGLMPYLHKKILK